MGLSVEETVRFPAGETPFVRATRGLFLRGLEVEGMGSLYLGGIMRLQLSSESEVVVEARFGSVAWFDGVKD